MPAFFRPLLALSALVAGLAAAQPATVSERRSLVEGQAFALWLEAGSVTVSVRSPVAAAEAPVADASAAAGGAAAAPSAGLDAGQGPAEIEIEAGLEPGQRLRWRESPGLLQLRLEDPARLRPRPAGLRLVLPPGRALRLDLGEAQLRLTGLQGGRLRVQGGEGEVAIEARDADVFVQTRNGSQVLRLQGGRLRADSLGGAIDLEAAGMETVSVETFSGDLRIALPADDSAALAFVQALGRAEVPEAFTALPQGLRVLGEGRGRVRLESFSGNVFVRTLPAGTRPALPPEAPAATAR
ncbi:MAG: hypothetical protein KatS3mg127_0244 [Silanimonas sp.]|nr:MAG: hypothetical protein KatS3mg127_0244 [Silanimonas sp.]